MYSILTSNVQNSVGFWGTPLRRLRRSPRSPSREGLLTFGNRSFAPSAVNPPLAPKHKILEPPLMPGPLCFDLQTTVHQNKFLFIFVLKVGLLVSGGALIRPSTSVRDLGVLL